MNKQTPEDAFYENITLGLSRTLNNLPRVCDLRWERRPPCEKTQMLNWEQRHCVYLPEDMKKFYLSTDGFVLYWSFKYGNNDIRRVGAVHMPHLLQITLLRENIDTNNSGSINVTTNNSCDTNATGDGFPTTNTIINVTPTNNKHTMKDRWGHATPNITAKMKMFEVNNVNNLAKVCLVYESTGKNNPKLYLLELRTYKWHFLADTFTEYLRMAIAHLGLPYWELCFSNIKLPPWTEQLYLLLAPHLLQESIERRGNLIEPGPEHPHNVLDPSVFRSRPKIKTHIGSSSSSTATTNTTKQKQTK